MAGSNELLLLQRVGGNRAVTQLLASYTLTARRGGAASPAPSVQRHALPQQPGSTDDADESMDEALQRTVQRARSDQYIPSGKALPDLQTAITARLKTAFQDDPVFAAGVLRSMLDKFERTADAKAKFTSEFRSTRKTLGRIEAQKSKQDPHAVVAALVAKVVPNPRKAAKAVQDALPTNPVPRSAAAKAHFNAMRGAFAIDKAYLSAKQKKRFATALKQLQVVQDLLGKHRPSGDDADAWKPGRKDPQWGEGVRLSSKVHVRHSPEVSKALSTNREAAHLDAFTKKVDRVDMWLRTILDPMLMLRVKQLPNIYMHTQARSRTLGSGRGFFFFPTTVGFRPSGDRKEIELPYDTKIPTIAHEMGHAIESYLPVGSWHDMNLLLERRHRKERKSSRKAVMGANIATAGVTSNEGRYAGTYATGSYTSTAYQMEGNAEVFSMAMEFFANPSDAKTIIEDDPQHAAIILRAIRLKEYAKLNALRAFDRHLPRSTAGGGTGGGPVG
jgi:hypothetical protein